MGILKWALYGGAAYLGYRALTKPTVDDIVEAAKLRLDPKLAWTIVHYVSTDTWSIAGFSPGQAAATAQSPMFTNAHDVLAWLKASPLTGSTANVTFNLGA
jgi:hypothetical protein